MKMLFIDCFAGAAGDMLLAALVHVGADEQVIIDLPKRLGLEGLAPAFAEAFDNGIAGLRFQMPLPEKGAHRHLPDINRIIDGGEIPDRVKKAARTAFHKLAEAEARVHNSIPEKVHFHEVGADDAIVDIVGYFMALDALGWPQVFCRPLPLGQGLTRAAHGIIPLPGPAVTEIVKGIPVRFVDFEGEMVTPTGAVLLATSASFEPCPEMTIMGAGYGMGSATYPDRPNMVRVVLGESGGGYQLDTVTVIETNIDDMNPQVYEHLFDCLYDAGALEAFVTPVIMKKSRPGNVLTVLCKKPVAPKLADVIFSETTTAGVRFRSSERYILSRREETVTTEFGDVRVKLLEIGGGFKIIPEFDDCRLLAKTNNIPVSRVIEAVTRLYPRKG